MILTINRPVKVKSTVVKTTPKWKKYDWVSWIERMNNMMNMFNIQ